VPEKKKKEKKKKKRSRRIAGRYGECFESETIFLHDAVSFALLDDFTKPFALPRNA